MYTHIYALIYIQMHNYTYGYLHTGRYACIRYTHQIYKYICIYTRSARAAPAAHAHAHARTHAHPETGSEYGLTLVSIYMCTHIHSCTQGCTLCGRALEPRVCARTHSRTHAHARALKRESMHAHIPTYIHTYVHACMHTKHANIYMVTPRVDGRSRRARTLARAHAHAR